MRIFLLFKKYSTFFTLVGTFLLFSLLAISITYPLIFHLADLVTGYGDELVIASIQNWVIHALMTNPLQLFNANILYPYSNTGALSDIFLPSSILAIPILKLVGQPIATFNFTFISSLALLGFSLYLLSYYLRKDYLASLLCGVIVIFSPAVLDKKIHLQILSLGWIPLSIVFFLIFMKSKQTRYFLLSCFFFVCQTANSFLPGYFLLVFYSIYVIFQWFYDKKSLAIFFVKKNVAIILITFGLIVPLAIPYFQMSHQFHAVRDIRETIHFALQPEDLLYGNDQTNLQPVLKGLSNRNHYPKNAEIKTGYLGAIFTLLTIFTTIFTLINIQKTSKLFKVWTTTAVFGLLMSFGPFLHISRLTIHKPFPIPLPYLAFYYLAPGFQGFRNSARWEMLFILSMAIAISLVLNQLLLGQKTWKKLALYGVLFLGIFLEFHFPIYYSFIPQQKDFPKIYHWLNLTAKSSSFIFMPIYNWNSPNSGDEILREYYMTETFRPMVNGYSGYSPIPWQQFITDMNNFPNDKTIQEIKQKNVTTIIVEKDKYDRDKKIDNKLLSGEEVLDELQANPSITFVAQIGTDYIFNFKKP